MEIAAWPVSWYPVATSETLRSGAVHVVQLGDNEIVVARGLSGVVFALDAHCPHMGAHLRHACVVGEGLQCPLHHWHLPGSGVCEGGTIKHRSWPIREQLGVIFLGFSNDPQLLPPVPGEQMLEQYYWCTGAPTDVSVDWQAAIVNGFDLNHMNTVHHREIVDEPILELSAAALLLKYNSRVTGNSLADKITKILSGNYLQIEQRCLGTTIEIRSQLKRISTAAVVSLLPTAEGVRVFCAFGVKPGPLAFLRGKVARQLFNQFLKKDIQVLEGMRMRLDNIDDAGVKAVTEFLNTLQQGPIESKCPPVGPPIAVIHNTLPLKQRTRTGA